MAKVLYGPDGRPIHVVGGNSLDGDKALQSVDWDRMEQEVAKVVRSQATTLSQVWDPSRGKPKPTSVTHRTLRMMAQRNEWVKAIVKTRKSQIGNTRYKILPKDDGDDSPATLKLCDKLEKLFSRPSLHGSRVYQRSWRQFIGEYLEDILVLDAGCIEKERTADKWIAAMYPVDGATIAPNMDERGGYHDDAYVQVVDGQITARFGMEDLVYTMDNPQTDVRFAGYGFSPLESLVVSVTAELYASKYNASYFEKGAVPEGMVNLGPEAAPEDVNAFRLYWMNEIMGRPWAIPIIGGSTAEWIPWRASNKDMEYMAYQAWLLKKICAVYQIPPQEIGELEDVNRSTANEQADTNKSKSIKPLTMLIADEIEVSVIGELGLGVGDYVEFSFLEEDEDEEAEMKKWEGLAKGGAATRNEWRDAVGEEPGDDPGLDLFLTEGQVSPLPESAEQAREEQAQQNMPPWMAEQGAGKPASGGKPGKPPAKPAAPYSKDKPQTVGKVTDEPPAELGEIEDDMTRVWERAETDLMGELTEILGVPLATGGGNVPAGSAR